MVTPVPRAPSLPCVDSCVTAIGGVWDGGSCTPLPPLTK
jgi:hypothetical protein